MIYFVQKEAVYYHGIYWIGFDYLEGVAAANEAAEKDRDSHHDWVLYQYTGVPSKSEYTISHKEVYRTNWRNNKPGNRLKIRTSEKLKEMLRKKRDSFGFGLREPGQPPEVSHELYVRWLESELSGDILHELGLLDKLFDEQENNDV